MSKTIAGSASDGTERNEDINQKHREALIRFGKYTAPAMLAMLMTGKEASAQGIPVSFISDARLKRDIAAVGELASGLCLYRYRYLWSDTVHVGVMAHEVAAVVPEAVRRGADGYLGVDYSRLGLRMQTWDEWVAAQ